MAFITKDISIKDRPERFDSLSVFPGRGNERVLYLANDTGILYQWDGLTYQEIVAQATVSSYPPYIEEKTSIAGSNAGAWVVRSLGDFYKNKEVTVLFEKTTSNTETVGIRTAGSVFDLSFPFRSGQVVRLAVGDANGEIEIYSSSLVINFWIIGTRATT